jgi:Poxvirus Late Transcription Factor VLTF3 like
MVEEGISLDKLLTGINAVTPTKQTNAVTVPSTTPAKTDAAAKTLDAFHTQNLRRIREERDQLMDLKRELHEKKRQFFEIEEQFNNPTMLGSQAYVSVLTGRQRLEKEIHALEERIRDIETGDTETDYFLRVGDILFSYTDAQDRIAAGQKGVDPYAGKKQRMPANSVYSYFASAAAAVVVEDEVQGSQTPAQPPPPSHTRKASEIITDIGFRRDKALESYLSALDPNNINNDAAVMSTLEENYGCCPVCDTEMFFNETFLDCSECGYREYILVDSEKPSYKDPPREMSYYAYKKINHLNEWLAQFQAKETTEIPASVLDQIRAELRKERITDMSKLKVSKLKEVLKKLKLSRCYDHVAHILNRLNGIQAPVLSREVEEKLRFMFKEIQFSFVKHCPKKRSNFLSYSFVLYKFCELLELDEYLPCFPLLKSREKLYMQDKIWELICKDMNWEFIRTV